MSMSERDARGPEDYDVTSMTPAASAATMLPIMAAAGVPRCLRSAKRPASRSCGHGDQETTRGLGIGQQQALRLGEAFGKARVGRGVVEIALGATRAEAGLKEGLDLVEDRHGGIGEARADRLAGGGRRGAQHVAEMA